MLGKSSLIRALGQAPAAPATWESPETSRKNGVSYGSSMGVVGAKGISSGISWVVLFFRGKSSGNHSFFPNVGVRIHGEPVRATNRVSQPHDSLIGV